MGRELKRVPIDFDWPIDTIWKGYDVRNVFPNHSCRKCSEGHSCEESAEYCLVYNPDQRKKWFYEPPKGDGYQMWETTTEGSPQSPVFETLDALCQWLEDNKASFFGGMTATKKEWMNSLQDGTAGMLILTKKSGV